MVGRIESYLHSDASTANKGGAMIHVSTQSDFAARTPEFVRFCRMAVQFVYAANAETWDDVAVAYPDLETARLQLQQDLHETVAVSAITVMHV